MLEGTVKFHVSDIEYSIESGSKSWLNSQVDMSIDWQRLTSFWCVSICSFELKEHKGNSQMEG